MGSLQWMRRKSRPLSQILRRRSSMTSAMIASNGLMPTKPLRRMSLRINRRKLREFATQSSQSFTVVLEVLPELVECQGVCQEECLVEVLVVVLPLVQGVLDQPLKKLINGLVLVFDYLYI